MKTLFLIFHGFEKHNGISKKIHYQVKALKNCNMSVQLCYCETTEHEDIVWKIDNKVIANYGHGIKAKINKKINFRPIINYIRKEKIQFIYMRSFHNANPFSISLVREIKKHGAKIVMEIPTYPYDQEYITPRMKVDLCIDRIFRKHLAKNLNAIVTFSNANQIFGKRTIQISNGIDFDSIPLKRHIKKNKNELHCNR